MMMWRRARVASEAPSMLAQSMKPSANFWAPGTLDGKTQSTAFTKAKAAGYGKDEDGLPDPYYGYRYRILTRQGPDAPGGAYDYVVQGRMIGGFALIAWPASYGNSGVMTFIVNHEGVVYEKDLGLGTATAVGKITRFNPDKSWKRQ